MKGRLVGERALTPRQHPYVPRRAKPGAFPGEDPMRPEGSCRTKKLTPQFNRSTLTLTVTLTRIHQDVAPVHVGGAGGAAVGDGGGGGGARAGMCRITSSARALINSLTTHNPCLVLGRDRSTSAAATREPTTQVELLTGFYY